MHRKALVLAVALGAALAVVVQSVGAAPGTGHARVVLHNEFGALATFTQTTSCLTTTSFISVGSGFSFEPGDPKPLRTTDLFGYIVETDTCDLNAEPRFTFVNSCYSDPPPIQFKIDPRLSSARVTGQVILCDDVGPEVIGTIDLSWVAVGPAVKGHGNAIVDFFGSLVIAHNSDTTREASANGVLSNGVTNYASGVVSNAMTFHFKDGLNFMPPQAKPTPGSGH
jgi:hypothetical protein